jgi:hypothetical protein
MVALVNAIHLVDSGQFAGDGIDDDVTDAGPATQPRERVRRLRGGHARRFPIVECDSSEIRILNISASRVNGRPLSRPERFARNPFNRTGARSAASRRGRHGLAAVSIERGVLARLRKLVRKRYRGPEPGPAWGGPAEVGEAAGRGAGAGGPAEGGSHPHRARRLEQPRGPLLVRHPVWRLLLT